MGGRRVMKCERPERPGSRSPFRRLHRLALVGGAGLFLLLSNLYPLDPAKDISQYNIDAYTTETGLPQSSVMCILQSRDGYLWLGTYEGLARFDGIRFTVFDKTNVPEFKNDSIKALLEDRHHNLWIGTPNGLLRYRDGSFLCFTTAEGLSSDFILSIHEDRAGQLWVGTTEGLNLLTGRTFHAFTTRDGLSHNYITALADDTEGTLWIGTGGGGVNRMKNGAFEPFTTANGLPNNDIRALRRDHQGRMWIGTSGGGLVQLDQGRLRVFSSRDGLSNDDVRAIYQDSHGFIWIGTNGGGLNRLKDGTFSALTARQGLVDNSVRSLFEDREGSLWIGTRHGLFRLKDDKYIIYNSRNGLPVDEARCIFESRDGTIWIGTQGGGLVAFKDGRFRTYGLPQGVTATQIWSIAQTGDDAIWFGTYGGGLYRLDVAGRISTFTTGQGLSNNIVRAIYVDRRDQLWVGTNGGGVDVLRNGRIIAHYSTRNGLSNDFIYSLAEDREGAIWVGTYSGGATRIKDGRFTIFDARVGLTDNGIWAIYPDADGSVWIGTDNDGLKHFEKGQFRTFAIKDGLFSDLAFQILEDNHARLWLNCNRGIFQVRKQDLADYAAGKIRRIPNISFGKPEGLKTIECGGPAQPAGCRSQDGKLWFPTIKGVVVFDPDRIPTNRIPPPVRIEQVAIDGRETPPDLFIEVPPGPGDLEIHYTGLSFLLPGKVVFRYRLEGYDHTWIEAGVRREAYYTNLPPAVYRFRVMACNNDGIWNQQGDEFTFELRPYFYRTWWFYLTLGVILAACGFGIYRLRVRQLSRRKVELENLVAERTSQLDDANGKLQKLVIIDDLTGIANHRRFQEFFNLEWRRAARNSRPLALILIDVDHFKNYNDCYGHQAGDICLRRIAQTLDQMTNRPGDLAARYGGEEFFVILPETNVADAAIVAHRLRAEVEALRIPHQASDVADTVTISLGVAAMVPSADDTPAVLIELADRAMYRAKQAGRNRVAVDGPDPAGISEVVN